MSFGLDSPFLDDSESWADASAAYEKGLKLARANWQPDARTALTEVTDYPPAHLDSEGHWQIFYWSPEAVSGLLLVLDVEGRLVRQEKWGEFYQEVAARVGSEVLGPSGFEYSSDISQPGPENLAFVLRRAREHSYYDFIDIQISTTIMLTPPPRRFTINMVSNIGSYPTFGADGGWTARLGLFLPNPNPDKWWTFKDVDEYEASLRQVLGLVVQYGLPNIPTA